MAEGDYAVTIGIAHYPEISELRGPENDAKEFHQWLINANGGAVPANKAELILSSYYPGALARQDARPIAQDINNTFERIISKGLSAPNQKTGRRLYIFMAGHGFSPDQDESALLMANAGASALYLYHVPGRCYAKWFIGSALFDEVILLMDCCRNDGPSVPIACPSWGQIRPAGQHSQVRKFFGFATRWTYVSREKPIPLPNGAVRGLFSKSVVEGLQGLACDQQGKVTSGKLKGYVQDRLLAFSREYKLGEYQSPQFEGDEDIVFAQGLCKRTHVRISFGQLSGDAVVELIGPSFESLGLRLPRDGTWEIDLVPGNYALYLYGTRTRKPFTVIGEVQDVTISI